MHDFDELTDRSLELEDQVDDADYVPLTDEELDELLEDDELLDEEDDIEYDDDMDGDHATGLRDAGFGTDEDYGYFGDDEDGWD